MMGMRWAVTVLLACTVEKSVYGERPYQTAIELAAEAFKYRGVSGILAFTCWGQDSIHIVRHLVTNAEPSASASASASFGLAVVDPMADPKVLRAVLSRQGQLRSPTRVGVLADAACPGTLRLLHLASRLRLFSHRHVWVILESGQLVGSNTTSVSDRASSAELASIADVPFQPMGPEAEGQPPRMTKKVSLHVHPPPARPPRTLTSNPKLLHDIGHRILSQLMVFVDSDVLWVQADTAATLSDTYVVRPGTALIMALQVFRSSMARELQVYQAAVAPITWEGVHWMWTLSRHDENDIVAARSDLQGALMRATTIVQTPSHFTTIDDVATKDYDILSKVQFNMVKNTAEALNFSMAIYFNDNYGWEMPNGSFDGMFGELKGYFIDMAATGILLRHDRLAYCEICAELFQLRTAMIFRQPPRSSVDNIFLLPFTTKLWVSIGCLLALIITFLALQTGLFAQKKDTAARHVIASVAVSETTQSYDNDGDHFSVSDVFMFVFGALCQQGFPKLPASLSARITTLSLFFTALFLFTSYSASIVAILQAPSHAVRSVSDIIASRIEIGIQDQPYNKVWFREADNPIIRTLYTKKIIPKGDKIYLKHEEGVRRLRSGFFAFQVEKNQGYSAISSTFLEDEKCDLSEFELFNLPILALPTVKRSPYREIISRFLRWHREVGLLKREHLRWETPRPNCGGSGNTFVRVGLQEFKPALQAFEYGLILALTMLLLEMAYHNRSTASHIYNVVMQRKRAGKKAEKKPRAPTPRSQTKLGRPTKETNRDSESQ